MGAAFSERAPDPQKLISQGRGTEAERRGYS